MHFLPPTSIRDDCTVTGLTPEYQSLLMPYAKGSQTSGPFGSIVTQTYTGRDFQICQHHFFIRSSSILYAATDQAILSINYMLKGSPVVKVPGMGDLILNEGSYQLFYVPVVNQEVWFAPGQYHSLHIVIDPLYLRNLVEGRPGLQQLLDMVYRNSDKLMPYAAGHIDYTISNLISKILKPIADAGEAALHLQAKVILLFLNYIRKHHSITQSQPSDSTDDSRIAEVKKYMDNNLGGPLIIGQLASHFGFSISTLQRQFYKQYKTPVYKYFFEQRMQQAMQLLESKARQVSEVADLLGYKNVAAFSHAFTKVFGNPPMYYLKGRRNPGSDFIGQVMN